MRLRAVERRIPHAKVLNLAPEEESRDAIDGKPAVLDGDGEQRRDAPVTGRLERRVRAAVLWLGAGALATPAGDDEQEQRDEARYPRERYLVARFAPVEIGAAGVPSIDHGQSRRGSLSNPPSDPAVLPQQ